MRTRVIVPVFSAPKWVLGCVDSISPRSGIQIELHLHSADPELSATCRELARNRGDVTLRAHGGNRGLSRTWNDGWLTALDEGADVVVIVNDDVRFGPGDLGQLAEAARDQRDRYIISCAGPHGGYGRRMPSHGFSCFAINPIALEVIGCFDQNFFPAYCEDQDFSRRAHLAGLNEANCSTTEVFHEGSAAIKSDATVRLQNTWTQDLNRQYYRRKWGGDGDHERFSHPFDDPRLGLRIAPALRHQPYGPPHDRVDRC